MAKKTNKLVSIAETLCSHPSLPKATAQSLINVTLSATKNMEINPERFELVRVNYFTALELCVRILDSKDKQERFNVVSQITELIMRIEDIQLKEKVSVSVYTTLLSHYLNLVASVEPINIK